MFSGVILPHAAVSMSFPLDAVTVAEPRSKGNVEPLVRLAAPDMATVDALILDRMQSQVPVIPLLAEGGRNRVLHLTPPLERNTAQRD